MQGPQIKTHLSQVLKTHKTLREQTHQVPESMTLKQREECGYRLLSQLGVFIQDSEYVTKEIQKAGEKMETRSVYIYMSLPMAQAAVASSNAAALLDEQFEKLPGSCMILNTKQTNSMQQQQMFAKPNAHSLQEHDFVPVYIHIEILLNDKGFQDTDTVQQVMTAYLARNGVVKFENNEDHVRNVIKSVKGMNPTLDNMLKDEKIVNGMNKMYDAMANFAKQGKSQQEVLQWLLDGLPAGTNITMDQMAEGMNNVNNYSVQNRIKACAVCKKVAFALKRCGQCQKVQYCSVECQKQDWRNGHKEICKKI